MSLYCVCYYPKPISEGRPLTCTVLYFSLWAFGVGLNCFSSGEMFGPYGRRWLFRTWLTQRRVEMSAVNSIRRCALHMWWWKRQKRSDDKVMWTTGSGGREVAWWVSLHGFWTKKKNGNWTTLYLSDACILGPSRRHNEIYTAREIN